MNNEKIKPRFNGVPFKADSPNGTMEYRGIAKFSPAGIVIEFESKFLGLISNEVKEVQIALDEIFDIRFRKGIYKFFAQIQIRLQNFAKFSMLPNTGGKIKLKIKREDYELAERAVAQTLRYMNENEPSFLDSGGEAHEQLPPAPTSVNELFDTEKLDKN